MFETMTSRRSFLKLSAALAVAGTSAGVAGCSTGQEAGSAGSGSAASTRTITDSCGRTVEVPAKLERIAATGPIAQQFLLTAAPQKLVGLATELTENQAVFLGEEVAALEVFGQIYGGKGDFNKEAVVAKDPQLIIDVGEAKDSVAGDLDALQEQIGIPCIHLDASTVDTFEGLYVQLAEILDESRCDDLATFCRDTCAEISELMGGIPEDERVRVAYLMGPDGLSAMAKGSFQGNVVDTIATNVVVVDDPSSGGKGDEVSMEQIAAWDPELIIFEATGIYDTVADDPTWQALTAIQSENYYEVPGIPYNWMSSPAASNQVLGMAWFARLCYPDSFDEALEDVAIEYFKLFYDYDLSEQKYDEMCARSL